MAKNAIRGFVVAKEDKQRIDDKIDAVSAKTGVTASLMKRLIYAESQYNVNAKGDGKYLCAKTGKIAPSWGLAQINECWHPEVSYEQATNEDFAINFMAELLLKGECHQWTTCRKPSSDG